MGTLASPLSTICDPKRWTVGKTTNNFADNRRFLSTLSRKNRRTEGLTGARRCLLLARRPLLLIVVAAVLLIAIQIDVSWRASLQQRDGLAGGQKEADVTSMQNQANIGASVMSAFSAPEGTPDEAGPIVMAVAITVDGRDVVAVKDEETAAAVRDALIAHYQQTVLKDATEIEQIRFQEKLAWHTIEAAESSIRTLDEAVTILRVGTDKVAQYEVMTGDTAWDIASRYGVSLERLSQANPGVDLDILSIGQAISVTFTDPYVHTQSVSLLTYEEAIPFTEEIIEDDSLWPWQYQVVEPGIRGLRKLTVRLHRDDSDVVSQEVIENKVLEQPRRQLSKKGTRLTPNLGTGSLHFPVNGTLTSLFGWRWGKMHEGIDIAAPEWTPVYAADSGMVTLAGWYSNYGITIKVDHGSGQLVTQYSHLIDLNVSLGETVQKGQLIGWVGDTGYSFGAHLHFEIHVNGTPVNPLDYYQN